MDTPEQLIDRFRRKLAALLVVKHAATWLTGWAFLWGTAVLVLRAGAGTPRPLLLWGLAGVPLALVPALLLARRQTPARPAVRALLDRHNALGGVLMAGAELPLGRWQETMPAATAPRLRWRNRRAGALFAAGA